MFGLGITEVIIILLAALVLLFGSKKIIEFARNLGRVSGEFKKGKQEIAEEIRQSENKVGNKE